MGFPGYIRRSGYLQGMFILIVLVSGIMGWGWLMSVSVERLNVQGSKNAEPDEIRELARIDTGSVMFQISPGLVADRVSRHPWVARANVTRLPTGTLAIGIHERVPIMQILLPSGRPGFYLDAHGYQMPPSSGSAYDIPLLTGYPEEYHPMSPTADVRILEFLKALANTRERAGILISEAILTQGEFWLRLEPSQLHDSTPVRLGYNDFEKKLERLAQFWDQHMVRRQDRLFELIDLRFSGQIIAREKARSARGLHADQ